MSNGNSDVKEKYLKYLKTFSEQITYKQKQNPDI